MTKNNLFNRKNKEQLNQLLESEESERTICSFYRYINIANLNDIRNQLYTKLMKINVLGRI